MTGGDEKPKTNELMEKLYELIECITETPQRDSTADTSQTMRQQLEAHINELIQYDFPKLVELLYRVDVSEKKLKELLSTHPESNSATLIADLLIERQLQKKAWRQAHKPDTDIPDAERW